MKRISHALTRWWIIGGFVLSLPAFADGPFSFESAPGRLPKDVVPIRYDIALQPDAKAMTIHGTESVTLQFRATTDIVILNSVNEQLSDVRLDGQAVKSVASDDDKQMTTIKLPQPQAKGRHTLTFSYTGKIESEPRGLFKQQYGPPAGPKAALLSTQMEPADARRMFPCWDEPAFRAMFRLSVTVPSAWATISNMPVAKKVTHGSLATTTFELTPKMPSYLVEFTAGDLDEVSASSEGVRFGIWATRGEEQYGKQALADAQRILTDYNLYFGYPYPLPKLDSISIPGGFAGAMENWGAITYNQQVLLVRPSSTLAAQQEVFSTQAHEMAHLWNGDLVTMGWWDDLWLNESFASWMAAKETDTRHPEWHWLEREDASRERAMRADARIASHAIQQHVTNELDAENAFDPAITYDKGQALLRMLEAYIGPDTFKKGIQQYIKDRAFSNATAVDLWNGLNAASGKDVGRIASQWTAQPGFPLITAAASCDPSGHRTIKLSQSRFLLQGADSSHAQWSVPLQIRVGAGGSPQPALLTQDAQTLSAGSCNEALSLNAAAIGYYRVRYDAATLATDTKSFGQLPVADRIALLDDQWALSGSAIEPLRSYLALAENMGPELDVRAWEQVESALSSIEYAMSGSDGHAAFATYARSVLSPAFTALGWDAQAGESPDIPELRRAIADDLGNWGAPDVIATARKRFEEYLAHPASLTPDTAQTVINIVARQADAATFNKLHDLAKAAKDDTELVRYYSALMLVKDDALADQAAQIIVSGEIPSQIDIYRLQFVMSLARLHPRVAWTTFREHMKELLASHSQFGPYLVAQYLPQAFWNGIPLDELQAFIRANVPPAMNDFIASGMESARYRLAQKQVFLNSQDAWKK